MNTYKKQNGMATILLVLLIGLSVMIITATVAKSLRSNKEASVSAHAQTNAQLMGWAGVSAFREYLIKQGNLNIQNLTQLTGKSVVLRDDYNSKKISAKNIAVYGCINEGESCTITAEISANNLKSQAATTIQAVYEFSIKNGLVTAAGASATVNLSGFTTFMGSLLEAELPNTKVTLQVDGDVYIGSSLVKGFRTKNISELTVNSTGDVRINCIYTNCSNTKINVNAKGIVELTNGGVYGAIHATEYVSLATDVVAESIASLDKVYVANSSIQLIHANQEVLLTAGAFGGYIYSNSNVTLSASRATNISAFGKVSMTVQSSVSKNIESAKHVYLLSSHVGGDIKAYDYVDLNGIATSRSKVNGSVIAKGKNLTSILLSDNYAVTLTDSVVDQNVYAKGRVGLFLISSIGGKILSDTATLTAMQKTELDDQLKFTIPRVVETIRINQQINDQLNFKTKVDVKVYKNEANYIFTKKNTIARIYLNKLRNEATGTTYMYKDGKQYAIKNNTETLVNDQGFYLGKYSLGAKEYVGAICLSVSSEHSDVKSGTCTSPIIGYLPRVSVEVNFEGGIFRDRFGFPRDYLYRFDVLNAAFNTAKTHTWYLRSNADTSSINNAAFAPGIFYFEGDLSLIGHPNINLNNSASNTFTNSFLAEGDIEAILYSPKVYSPYNVLREVSASTICSRQLRTIKGADAIVTTPASESTQYLTPVNLCKNATEFKYDMNLDSSAEKINVTIDNESIEKLDLGYVALMSNKMIRYGTCAKIYGDVLARSAIEASNACIHDSATITGNISSQGIPPYLKNVQQLNSFGSDSKTIVPNQAFSNTKNTIDSQTQTGLVIHDGTLKWAKYL